MIVLVFIAVVLTLLGIACHIETLSIQDPRKKRTGIILTISLYSINSIIILILIYKVLSL